MPFGSITKASIAVALLSIGAGCRPSKRIAPVIGEAYVGPAALKIRSDIPLQSAPVATVKHGERLEILQRRRRFLRVRTGGGAEGWTDERQLLSADDIASLKELTQRAAKLPAQGQALSYGDLNVHMQPATQSPSFLQVKEKEKVDVLVQIRAPRTDVARKPLIPPPPKKAKVEPKKTAAKPSKYPPPPMPKPPSPPTDWLDLSKTGLEDDDAPPEEQPEAKPTPTDAWSLIRTPSGQSGWVLTRRLTMAIPDEVAQYAEGRRIVSYFSLGKVDDGDVKKDIWLWTTSAGGSPYDFDSFRVFIWSLRRHRYETAYIDRNVNGYAPVLLKDVDFSTAVRAKDTTATARYPGFSICVEKPDGQRYRREYALLSNIVRYAGEYPCETVPPVFDLQTLKTLAALPAAPTPPPQPAESFLQRMKKRLRALTHPSGG